MTDASRSSGGAVALVAKRGGIAAVLAPARQDDDCGCIYRAGWRGPYAAARPAGLAPTLEPGRPPAPAHL